MLAGNFRAGAPRSEIHLDPFPFTPPFPLVALALARGFCRKEPKDGRIRVAKQDDRLRLEKKN